MLIAKFTLEVDGIYVVIVDFRDCLSVPYSGSGEGNVWWGVVGEIVTVMFLNVGIVRRYPQVDAGTDDDDEDDDDAYYTSCQKNYKDISFPLNFC